MTVFDITEHVPALETIVIINHNGAEIFHGFCQDLRATREDSHCLGNRGITALVPFRNELRIYT